MLIQHTKMVCDPMELYEARLLEMPFKDGKLHPKNVNFKSVDFKTLYKTHRDIQRACKLSRKIIKFNKI